MTDNYLRRNRSGQSTIEYMLLATVVVVIVIAFLAKGGVFEHSVNNTLKLPAAMTDIVANKVTFHQVN